MLMQPVNLPAEVQAQERLAQEQWDCWGRELRQRMLENTRLARKLLYGDDSNNFTVADHPSVEEINKYVRQECGFPSTIFTVILTEPSVPAKLLAA